MCTKSFFRSFGAFVAALVLCFALSVPALADDLVNGTAVLKASSFSYSNGSGGSTFENNDLPVGNSRNGWFPALTDNTYPFQGIATVSSVPSLVPSGAIGIYFSFYYASTDSFKQNKVPTSSDFKIALYSTSVANYVYRSPSSFSIFSPNNSQHSKSDGVSLVFRVDNSVGQPFTSWIICNGKDINTLPLSFYVSPVSSWSGPYSASWYVTSFRVVSTSSNAELDALEDMASEIANQSQILSQFYGDIVAVCNQIYQRLGDLQAAQEEANRLFSNVISLLNTTNGKIEAINMAMSTYFELLINQLKQEGIDTRTAIADAELRLELYLKPMIDYFNELEEQTGESASTLPQHKQDIDGFNNEGFGIDSDGQAGLAAILPILSAFSFILSILGIFIGLGVLGVIIKKGAS